MPETRFELWQDGILVAAAEGEADTAQREALHYVAQYLDDGPVIVKERISGRMVTVAKVTLA